MRAKAMVLVVSACMLVVGLGGARSRAEIPPPPQVGPDWAIVTATIDPQDTPLSCSFQYEFDAQFVADGDLFLTDAEVPCDPQPTGSGRQTVSARITGLTPSTTYHYRVVVADQGGRMDGADTLFRTLPPPPTVTTAPATEMTARSVKLNGTVDPHASAVSDCHFEYGPTSAYGQQAPCDPMPSAGDTAVPVSATVPWIAGSPLHYRLVATTASGTSAGEDVVALVIVDLPPPPTIAGSRIQTIARPTATGAATVNPNGSATECWFESGSARIPCTPEPGDGTAPVAVTGGIPVFGSIISFHVVATNVGGTTYGPQVGMSVFWVPPPGLGTLRVVSIGRPRRGTVTLNLACDGDWRDFCRGKLTLAARVRLHGRRRAVVLGGAPYDLTAGAARATIAVRLSARARRLLRLHPRLRIASHAVPAARAA